MDQISQACKTTQIITDESVLALSWNIATEPTLYRELAQNPYSVAARKIISKRFPDVSIVDVIRAIVLAEPEGKYDRNFRQLPKEQQAKELAKQRDSSTKLQTRLMQYRKKYAKACNRLDKAFLYDTLSRVVFETADVQKIEQTYAQSQRRDVKLAIVSCIEHTQKDEKPTQRPGLQAVFALSFILLFYLAYGLYEHQFEQKQTVSTTHYPEAKKQLVEVQKENQGFPMRLKIPKINVNAAVEYVGLTSKGAMDVPNNTIDVGWFKLGSYPGENGSAVIAGHFDGEDGSPGVFTNLYKLQQGDKVYIDYANGISLVFVVRETRTYNPGHADAVFSRSDKAHLNLITCDGKWDIAKKIYTKRLVVFADITH